MPEDSRCYGARATAARIALVLVVAAAGCMVRTLGPPAEPTAEQTSPVVPLLEGLGDHHMAITTSSTRAQRYFDQGLVLTYAFNDAEAIGSYRDAIGLDPDCAMCFWGVALALGPSIDAPMDPADASEALHAVAHAMALRDRVGANERALIEALAVRYSGDPDARRKDLDRRYADAMRSVVQRFPDDRDAETLFAEALLDLSPGDYWTAEGKPKGHTLEAVTTLEDVLAHDPDHPGANHDYIHAVEGSKHPEWALASADRIGRLAPAAGHLVHMAAHIYMRVGRYHDASVAAERAVESDERYLARCHGQGCYPEVYYPHNLRLLFASASMEGRGSVALDAARRLEMHVAPEKIRATPALEEFYPTALFAMARFEMWSEALDEPEPPDDLVYSRAVWHYVRGLAHAMRHEPAQARNEQQALDRLRGERTIASLRFPGGRASSLLEIASEVLYAARAQAEGLDDDAARHLRRAVKLQDALPRTQPPGWYFPVRQALGSALIAGGRSNEAVSVFREDLRRNPANGWSLHGLMRCLEIHGKKSEARRMRAQFEKAWTYADLSLADSPL